MATFSIATESQGTGRLPRGMARCASIVELSGHHNIASCQCRDVLTLNRIVTLGYGVICDGGTDCLRLGGHIGRRTFCDAVHLEAPRRDGCGEAPDVLTERRGLRRIMPDHRVTPTGDAVHQTDVVKEGRCLGCHERSRFGHNPIVGQRKENPKTPSSTKGWAEFLPLETKGLFAEPGEEMRCVMRAGHVHDTLHIKAFHPADIGFNRSLLCVFATSGELCGTTAKSGKSE